MKINTMIEFNETRRNYMPYYIIPVIVAILVGYFLVFGGKVLTWIFILVLEYWWASIAIVLVILCLWKKLRTK